MAGIELINVHKQYRVEDRSGRSIWMLDKGRLMYDNEGREYFYSVIIDIDQTKHAQEELRLGLERGATAREAVEVITGLLEQYGQRGNASRLFERRYENSYMVMDPMKSGCWRPRGADGSHGRFTCTGRSATVIPLSGNSTCAAATWSGTPGRMDGCPPGNPSICPRPTRFPRPGRPIPSPGGGV